MAKANTSAAPAQSSGVGGGEKRKVTKSAKAQALDDNPGSDSETTGKKGKRAAKRKGKGKRKKGAPVLVDDDQPSESSEEDENEDEVKIDWKDIDLTWSLLTAITDDLAIKQGLFPSPGANVSTAKGGGKPKTDHQYALAVALFAEHPKYSEVFKLAKDSKGKAVWAKRIKNRLQNLVKKTREHLNVMGETGAGITAEDQINMDQDNEFTNKWKVIKAGFPWLWVMKELISERPNIVPVGLGNNRSAIDMSPFASGYNSDLESSMPDEEENEMPVNKADEEEVDSEVDVAIVVPQKRSGKSVEKKTGARPGKSNPARRDTKKAKVIDRFAEISKAEEETNRKQLELKKIRVQGQTQASIAKIQAQAEIQIQKNKLKAEARMEEKRQAHEFRMAQFQLQVSRQQRSSNHRAVSSSAGYSSPSTSGSLSFNNDIPFDFNNFDFEVPVVAPSAEELQLPIPPISVEESEPFFNNDFTA